jgi:hypothetical protein
MRVSRAPGVHGDAAAASARTACLYDDDGALITSSAGAMGLMQVMPRSYETVRDRYGLGDDPYEPRNKILAGATRSI